MESGLLSVNKAITEMRRKEVIKNLEDIRVKETKKAEGIFDVIVTDPPWPMEKIERDVAPNQVVFEYPTMTIEEIKNIKYNTAPDCHLWLWTTHKFLPIAFDILKEWNAKYVCTFVWHKSGGFQPFNLPQYNCEFALYARIGIPQFIDLKNLKVCFDAPRGRHSAKPEIFYEMVKRITAGRRLDDFSREKHDGFEPQGKEAK
jgi:N6-adenosine-specific RNA methylase IME4